VRKLVEHHGHDEDDYGKDEGYGIHDKSKGKNQKLK
jgi:hypothetical protein